MGPEERGVVQRAQVVVGGRLWLGVEGGFGNAGREEGGVGGFESGVAPVWVIGAMVVRLSVGSARAGFERERAGG